MKNFTKKIVGYVLMTFVMLGLSHETLASSEKSNTATIIVKDDLIGGWEYSVEGAPEGYEKGFLLIVKQGDVYKAQIQLSTGAVNAENVVVKGNKISFTVTIEGETVSVALEAKGSKLTGTSTSASNGSLNIMGSKSISPE